MQQDVSDIPVTFLAWDLIRNTWIVPPPGSRTWTPSRKLKDVLFTSTASRRLSTLFNAVNFGVKLENIYTTPVGQLLSEEESE